MTPPITASEQESSPTTDENGVGGDGDSNNLGNENETPEDTKQSRENLPKEDVETQATRPGEAANKMTTQENSSKVHVISVPSATKAPKDTLYAVYAAGKYKAGLSLDVLAVQCAMAGIYIAAASHLFLAVGGGILGAALFPGGLMAVVLTSAELFTGDALIFVASVLGKQVKFSSLVRNWTVAWCFNFVGALLWAYFIAYLSNAIEDSGAKELAIKVAKKKAHQTVVAILFKSMGANFCVCVGVWQATCAAEVAGKVLALWFPVTAFVAMGFDHVIANQFFIPIGMMLGADITIGECAKALAMATVGNLIGGGIFVGAVYWYVFDSMSNLNFFRTRIRQGMTTPNHRQQHGGNDNRTTAVGNASATSDISTSFYSSNLLKHRRNNTLTIPKGDNNA